MPVIGVIENMSYFVCPDCGSRHDILAHGGGRTLSEKLAAPFLGEIPIDERARIGGDVGKPVVLGAPDSPAAKAFAVIAAALSSSLESLSKARRAAYKADPALRVLN